MWRQLCKGEAQSPWEFHLLLRKIVQTQVGFLNFQSLRMSFCDVRLWQVCSTQLIPFLILAGYLYSCSHQHQSRTFSRNAILWKKYGVNWNGIQSTYQEYFWVSSMELGLFIFISLEPKLQWSAMKKAKPLNVNGPRPTLTWKAWPLLRLVVIFLAHECVVIQPIFSLLLLYASKNCKS